MQGRIGPSPLQPYRELRRLWGKSTFLPEGTTLVYRLAPAVVAAAFVGALPCSRPAATQLPRRLGTTYSSSSAYWPWPGLRSRSPPGTPPQRFALMAPPGSHGGGRREGLIVLCVALVGSCRGQHRPQAHGASDERGQHLVHPAHWCALLAFAVVAITETGRQPIDNPDTHLELTMIHEGPLEYSGRDSSFYLQWSVAARH